MADIIPFPTPDKPHVQCVAELRQALERLGLDQLEGAEQVLLLVSIDLPNDCLEEVPIEELTDALNQLEPGQCGSVEELLDAVAEELGATEEGEPFACEVCLDTGKGPDGEPCTNCLPPSA